MGKKDTDKKLGRFSTILEIITNLGQIFTWVLGVGSAYVLNIQTKPIVVPGIDITLDSGFQFALLISAMLGYIHFLQRFWEKNVEKLKLSDTFLDFSFWDIPRLKQPLLLIPIVIASVIFIQVSIKSAWLVGLLVVLVAIIVVFIYKRSSYHLSPQREYEKQVDAWLNDPEWIERWTTRIRNHLSQYIGVRERDFYISGKSYKDEDSIEINVALLYYFEKFEFEEDLVLVRLSQLHDKHPYYYIIGDNEWVLMPKKNLEIRREN